MKTFIKRILHKLGLELKARPSRAYPYLRDMEVAGHSFRFWIASESGRLWYDYRTWEKGAKGEYLNSNNLSSHELDAILSLVESGDTVLEIGSHHGMFTTLLALQTGKRGCVIGMEADPQNAIVAQAQTALNKEIANYTILNNAAADKNQDIYISQYDNHIQRDSDFQNVPIKAIAPDSLLDEFGPFDLIKMDIEGFEAVALDGCVEILKHKPKIALELHLCLLAEFGSSVDDVLAHFPESDYSGDLMLLNGDTVIFSHEFVRSCTEDVIFLYLRPTRERT